MVLDEGDMAEDFVLPTHDGKSIQLASYKNQKKCGSVFLPKKPLVWMPIKKGIRYGKKRNFCIS